MFFIMTINIILFLAMERLFCIFLIVFIAGGVYGLSVESAESGRFLSAIVELGGGNIEVHYTNIFTAFRDLLSRIFNNGK